VETYFKIISFPLLETEIYKMNNMRTFLFVLISFLFFSVVPAQAQSYKKMWKEVETYQKKDLPKSVVESAYTIYRKAQAEHNAPQMMSAYLTMMDARCRITPDSLEKDVDYLKHWAKTEKDSVNAAVLYSILGEIIMPQHPKEALEYLLRSLQPKAELDNCSANYYVPLVEDGDASVLYEGNRMYPMLVHRVLDLVKNNRYYLASEGVDVKKEIAGLYHTLLCYFSSKGQRAAYVLTRVNEINFENDYPIEMRLSQYQKLIDNYGDVETCAEAYLGEAEILNQIGRRKEAVMLLEKAMQSYPKYRRINALKSLYSDIKAPVVRLRANTLYPQKPDRVFVSYCNVTDFYLKIYRTDITSISEISRYSNENAFWKGKWKLFRTEHYNLSATPDYMMRDTTFTITIPEEGFYLFKAVPGQSYSGKFEADPVLVYVSSIGVVYTGSYGGKCNGVILDMDNGHPIPNAVLELYTQKRGQYILNGKYKADEKGYVEWPSVKGASYLRAVAGNRHFMPILREWLGGNHYVSSDKKIEHTQLYTDRILYRPGQTVYVSGITFWQENDSVRVTEGKQMKIILKDVNYKQVSEKVLTSNEFGSFHTSFVLPEVCLNGRFSIYVNNQLSTSIQVEEYKRPSFELLLEPVKSAYTYGDTVWIHGSAKMFTGMPVQNATVKYTIKALQYYTRWKKDSESTVSNQVKTDSAGRFSFPMVLKRLKADAFMPSRVCTYEYTVEVTSEAGDVQKAFPHRLLVEDNPYSITCSCGGDEWIKEYPTPKKIMVRNRNDQELQADILYEVYKLIPQADGQPIEGKRVYLGTVKGNTEFVPEDIYRLPSGLYRLKMAVKDGRAIQDTASVNFTLVSLSEKSLPLGVKSFLYQEGKEFGKKNPTVYFGSCLKDVCVYYEVYNKEGLISKHQFALSDSICSFTYPYKAEYGDGISVSFCFVKDGLLYMQTAKIVTPVPDKQLTMKWRSFRDKLQAGGKEEWSLNILDAKGRPVNAEMMATLYDASLDNLAYQNRWTVPLFFARWFSSVYYRLLGDMNYDWGISFNLPRYPYKNWTYSHLAYPFCGGIYDPLLSLRGTSASVKYRMAGKAKPLYSKEEMSAELSSGTIAADEANQVVFEEEMVSVTSQDAGAGDSSISSSLDIRQNFAETAFFYPQLRSNEQGEVDIVFTLPESLTTWRFLGLAHTKNMDYGSIDTTVVASKEFMLQAYLPRFVRVGDRTSFAATLSNLSAKQVKGEVRMELFDPVTEKVFHTAKQSFRVNEGRTAAVSFTYDIPDTYKVMACRMVADGGTFSDGEQHLLPVLSDKEWITESVSVSMNTPGTKTVDLNELFNNQSPTVSDRHLTVEFTGNPSWLAVMALPSIGNPSDKNALSLSAAFYSASLASWIVEQNPRIRSMFEAWKTQGGKDTFLSKLQQNQELKDLLLEASPFLQDAESETERHYRLATLFDVNALQNQKTVFLDQLKKLQTEEGGWSWYEGMDANLYMTTAIVETLLRLRSLTGTVDKSVTPILTKGISYLDKQAVKEYKSLLKLKQQPETLSEFASHYLYVCMLADRKLTGDVQKAYSYFFEKLKQQSPRMTIYGKAVAAMVLAKGGQQAASNDFMKSLLQYSVYTPEMGRYYDTNIALSTWADFRIPTQTIVIEAFYKLGGSKEDISQMQQWLLKQKQVQSWDTPVNTVNAVYALLLDNASVLSPQPMPELLLDGKPLSTEDASIGLNSIKETVFLPAGTKAPRTFTVRKENEGVAWGAVYAQYTEDIDKISNQSEGLLVARTFYVERLMNGSLHWVELKGGEKLKVGDKVKSSLRVSTDRDMDFVQIKENRASCMEPAAVLSGYRWEDGIGYYRAIKDASTEYYIDKLRKGTCTIESVYYITLEGDYEAGIVKVQSAYAPEFNAHTSGRTLKVKK